MSGSSEGTGTYIPLVGDIQKTSGQCNAAALASNLLGPGGDLAGAVFAGEGVSAEVSEKLEELTKKHPMLRHILAQQLGVEAPAITPGMLSVSGVLRNAELRKDADAGNESGKYVAGGLAGVATAAAFPLSIPLIGPLISGAIGTIGGSWAFTQLSGHKEDKYCRDTIDAMENVLSRREVDTVTRQALLALQCDDSVQSYIEGQLGMSLESAILNGDHKKLAQVVTSEDVDMLIRLQVDPQERMAIMDANGKPVTLAEAYTAEGVSAAEMMVGDVNAAVDMRRMHAYQQRQQQMQQQLLAPGQVLARNVHNAQTLNPTAPLPVAREQGLAIT